MTQDGSSALVSGELLAPLLEAIERSELGLFITADRGDESPMQRLYTNRAGAAIFGCTVEEMSDVPVLARVPPEEQVRLGALREAVLRGEPVPPMLETAVVDRAGERIPVEVGMARTRRGDRWVTVTFMRDVRARHRTEAALRDSEQRFRQLAEVSPDGIGVACEGLVVYVNPAMLRILGYDTAGQLRGIPFADLIVEGDQQILAEHLRATLAGEHAPPREYRGRRRDGSIVPLECLATAATWEGRPALVGTARDVSDRKRLQLELLRADRMATIGTIATGVAHEINNPLTYLLIYLQQLRKAVPGAVAESRSGEFARLLDTALEGAERVRGAVRDLLSFARADEGQRQPIDVRAAMDRVLALATPTLRGRARVTVAMDDDVPRIDANEATLGQALLNLVVNAAQSFAEADESKNHVEISIRSCDGGEHVEIVVADDGPGIPEAIRPKVFEPFFTTKGSGQGSGLGLAVTKAIVEALDGRIDIEHDGGAHGRGTRLRVTLPARRTK